MYWDFTKRCNTNCNKKNSASATAIEINNTAVEIKQPLKIQSIESNLIVKGVSNIEGNLSVSRSAPTGSGNVTISATNSGNEGFASLYLQTNNQTLPITNETGQIYVGQSGGMNIITRSNHPISFKTYSDEPLATVSNSMQILGSGTRRYYKCAFNRK